MSSKCYRSFEHYIKMNQLFLLTFLIHFLEQQVKSINHSQSSFKALLSKNPFRKYNIFGKENYWFIVQNSTHYLE